MLLREKLGKRNVSIDMEIESGDMNRRQRRIRSDVFKELEKVKLRAPSKARDFPGIITGKGKGSGRRWGFARPVIQWQIYYGGNVSKGCQAIRLIKAA